ncbi:MAG: hypothetical protein VYA65_11455, partial [Pseudomonadota bacterium]|nr:hypothetical protein [Pseudomonadota bacterium]
KRSSRSSGTSARAASCPSVSPRLTSTQLPPIALALLAAGTRWLEEGAELAQPVSTLANTQMVSQWLSRGR